MKYVFKIDRAAPTANLIWRTFKGRTVLSKEYREFIAAVAAAVKVKTVWEYVSVYVTVRPKRRIGDVGNRSKAVMDALTRAGFWEDDKIVARVVETFAEPLKKYPNGATLIVVAPAAEKWRHEEW